MTPQNLIRDGHTPDCGKVVAMYRGNAKAHCDCGMETSSKEKQIRLANAVLEAVKEEPEASTAMASIYIALGVYIIKQEQTPENARSAVMLSILAARNALAEGTLKEPVHEC